MFIKTEKKSIIKYLLAFSLGILTLLVLLAFSEATAQAKTIVIKTPEELTSLNWEYKGFGPGNTYVIGNGMTITDTEEQTCVLTKGNFVIDFNGNTVQNASHNTIFKIAGANVILMDSKAKDDTPSIRSYGLGCIELNSGTLEIKSGNYLGDGGGGDSSALYVSGGVCVVNGGVFLGRTYGAVAAGGNLFINNNAGFRAVDFYAIYDMAGGSNIKISRARLIGGNLVSGQPGFAIGALTMGNYYDFSKWLANGSSFSADFQTVYTTATRSGLSQYPSQMYNTAVPYSLSTQMQVSELQVTNPKNNPVGLEYLPKSNAANSNAAPARTKITSAKSKKKKTAIIKWKKKGGVNGYQVQYSTNKKMKKAKKKTVKASKARITLKKLKSKKTYYVRVRSFKTVNGKRVYSKWSKVKKVKIK